MVERQFHTRNVTSSNLVALSAMAQMTLMRHEHANKDVYHSLQRACTCETDAVGSVYLQNAGQAQHDYVAQKQSVA